MSYWIDYTFHQKHTVAESILTFIINDEVKMITYLDISIFNSPAQTLVNTVNTVGVMGKGIALTFKQLYPEMYRKYRRLCEQGTLRVGMLFIHRTPNKIIINFPTKEHWRNPSRLDYIDVGLRKFLDRYQDYGITSVSFPQLGCGNGELNWENQVQPLMEKYLKDIPIPVYIHIYQKTPGFIPERLDETFALQARLERQRVSTNQLWQDLQRIITENRNSMHQLSFFPEQVHIDESEITIGFELPFPKIIIREDIEELWNVLRIRGTINDSDIPKSILTAGLEDWLYDLFGQLPYIRRLNIRKKGSYEYSRGLQYLPLPLKSHDQESTILI